MDITIKNKELIEKLIEYFLQQDPKIIARILANTMIDLNRAFNFEELPIEEKDSFIKRMAFNQQELSYFAENGPKGPLTIKDMSIKRSK